MSDDNEEPDYFGDPLIRKPPLIGPAAELKIHPLALAFPAYSKADLAKLACDIRDNGMRQPITLFEGMVLDGRNRLEAAKRAGLVNIIIGEFKGNFEQARAYVISMNLIRRHLDTGQRAMIAAELANMTHGGDRSKQQNCGLPTKAAAKQLKVSPRSVETAKAVRKANPALAEEVKQGKTKLAAAAKKVSKHSLPGQARHGLAEAQTTKKLAPSAFVTVESKAAKKTEASNVVNLPSALSAMPGGVPDRSARNKAAEQSAAILKEHVKALIETYGFRTVFNAVMEQKPEGE